MQAQIGVERLQSRLNCWFCGRMGHKSNFFEYRTKRLTLNWIIFLF